MRLSRVRVIVAASVIGLHALAAATPVLAAVCDGSGSSLGNGGFETPIVAANTFVLLPGAAVPPWQTTDGLGEIELWGTGFNAVPAFEGNAFAELNANTFGTLYQDVVSTPGETMTWSLAHRARIGDDVMEVLIGDANVADVNGSTGWNFTSAGLTDDTSAWGTHTDEYVVPAGQTCTRFAFRAVSTGSGSDSVGNFLDAVAFSIAVPPSAAPSDPPAAPTAVLTAPPTDGSAAGPASASDLRAAALLVLLTLAGAGLAARRSAQRARIRS